MTDLKILLSCPSVDLDQLIKWLASFFCLLSYSMSPTVETWSELNLVHTATHQRGESLFLLPLGENLLLLRVLLVLTGLLIRVGLGRLWLVKLFEAEGLLLFGADALALSQLALHVLHLLPQVAVGFLQGAHLLREGPDPLLLLEQSLLHCGAHQLKGTEGNEEFTKHLLFIGGNKCIHFPF